jgi:hypothetical protein
MTNDNTDNVAHDAAADDAPTIPTMLRADEVQTFINLRERIDAAVAFGGNGQRASFRRGASIGVAASRK